MKSMEATMSKTDRKATETRIAQLQTEEAHETRESARKALRTTIQTLKAKLG
jgi:hypothetical protein